MDELFADFLRWKRTPGRRRGFPGENLKIWPCGVELQRAATFDLPAEAIPSANPSAVEPKAPEMLISIRMIKMIKKGCMIYDILYNVYMCVYVIYAVHSRWKWLQCEHLLATLVMLEDAWWIHPWDLRFSRLWRRCDVMHWGIERRYSTGSDQFPHRRWSEEVHGADDGLQEWSKPKQLAKDEWMVQLHKAIRSSYFWHDHSFVVLS